MKVKHKHLRTLHIYCSLICCTLLLVFSLTGLSLNHRALFEATPEQTTNHHTIDNLDIKSLNLLLREADISLSKIKLSELILHKELSLPSPGKRLELYIEDQQLFIESTDFGLVSQLNELHQGRYTSSVWKAVSDITALVFILIAITGIWLSLRDKKQRRNYLYFLSLSAITFILFME
ncbi:PepSY-associated TM helix domain-containing protein [Cognaticolwellia aestuarii]|uniref:PepSY-associated TM helix domain-containing protein n=1 Tax=Cognaticolwellia aestuarii TaxID=329993 RepID=UPI00098534CA|nr:PepSY-associated TM helix domain-containing protein [Cognaticolwellia aestuarii]